MDTVPQGYLRIPQIVGERAVSEEEADKNRRVARAYAAELKELERIKKEERSRFDRDPKLQERYRKLRAASSRPRRARPALQALIPISEASWWSGVRSGRYPRPIKLSPHVTCWRAADVFALLQPGAAPAQETPAAAAPA